MIPEKYLAYLALVTACKSKTERQSLLRILCRDAKFIRAVKLICANTVNRNVQLTERQKKLLRPHAKAIAYIGHRSSSCTRVIEQSGAGFLSVLLPIVTTLIGAAINGANSKVGNGPG